MPLPEEIASEIDLGRTAFVQIDMQRRHVDPEVGYHLLDPQQNQAVVSAAKRTLAAARKANAPVVHVATFSRHESPWGFCDAQSPFWKYQSGKIVPGMGKPRQTGKNLEGSRFAEFLPDLAPTRNEPVVIKKRYSGFYQTDLEMILRGFRAETLFIWGVNTNNCVLATAYDAFSRDFRIVVVADACGSMNGPKYHAAALVQIEAALGFTMSVDELERLLGAPLQHRTASYR
jgi:nicotinamidase-related amidase